MTATSTPRRRDTDRLLLQSTIIDHPSGGSEVVIHGDSDDLAMTAFIAVDPDDMVDLAATR